MTNTKLPQRITWLDHARAFAIAAVILVHSTENLYAMNTQFLSSVRFPSALFAMTAFTIGRLGVPFFLFLTGYLLLDRVFDSAKWQRFFHKNWMHLVITTEIWIVLYDIFLRLFHYQHWSTTRLLKNILFLTPVNMPHIWYMPMIIGLYLFIPFAARGLQNLELQTLRMPLGIISIYAFAVPVLQVLWKDFSLGDIHSLLDYGFTGGVYGLYLLFGFLVKKGLLKNIHTPHFVFYFCLRSVPLYCFRDFPIHAVQHIMSGMIAVS